MAKRHEAIVRINDRGMLELTCTCGRLDAVTGRKITIVRGWDGHLGNPRVPPEEAGRLNLNLFTDPDQGPVQIRDLSRFAPDVVARIWATAPINLRRELPRSPDKELVEDVPLPEPPSLPVKRPTTRPTGEKLRYWHGIELQPDRPGPENVSFRIGSVRSRRERAVVWACTRAERSAVAAGFEKLRPRQRQRLVHAMQLVAASEFFDLFRFPRLLAQFAEANGIGEWSLTAAMDELGEMLESQEGVRYRVREVMNIVGEEERIWLVLPPGWQQILDESDD